MGQMQSGDQIVHYDAEQTRNAYSSMKSSYAERCGCSYCRNFAAQRSTVYPENLRLLAIELWLSWSDANDQQGRGPHDSVDSSALRFA
ncbi:MAG: hypothetical protein DMG85_22185 [Acidobacteria bacterium]|nr:MAG: hypothetical protein DMG85_22185 [Acidobacteriota bacterium]